MLCPFMVAAEILNDFYSKDLQQLLQLFVSVKGQKLSAGWTFSRVSYQQPVSASGSMNGWIAHNTYSKTVPWWIAPIMTMTFLLLLFNISLPIPINDFLLVYLPFYSLESNHPFSLCFVSFFSRESSLSLWPKSIWVCFSKNVCS